MKDLRFKIFDCRLREERVRKSEIRNLKSKICMGCEFTEIKTMLIIVCCMFCLKNLISQYHEPF